MAKIAKLWMIASALLISGGVFAQNTEDIYRISFKNRASGTARSASMGGAFTSLGADVSSMNLNPAGIGMYRSSEVSITPSLFLTSVTSTSKEDQLSMITKQGRSSVNVNNISAIFNLYNNEFTNMRGFTLGISYYNDRFSKFTSQAESGKSHISIGDYFAAQLYGTPQNQITVADDDSFGVYRANPVDSWGAIMAYNNVLFEEKLETSGKNDYFILPETLAPSDYVLPSQRVNQKSSIDNFSVSMGTNISDMLYLGMTMGSRMYAYSRESIYQEDGVSGNTGDFKQMIYSQQNTVTGAAFDFKLGATLEPLSGLKIGVAYHFPTITLVKDEYYGDLSNRYFNKMNGTDTYNQSTPYNPIEYKVKSAPALLTGISYRLPFAILSFDYQKTWYDKMEIRNIQGASDFNRMVTDTYKAANSYMVGLEVQPIAGFFLRGGYAHYGSSLKYEDPKFETTTNISFGFGYRTNAFYMDLAYINSTYKPLPFRYYGGYFVDPKNDTESLFVASPSIVSQKFSDNIISLTVGFRF